jgi:tetratricopeptide (TPR) repeat protein
MKSDWRDAFKLDSDAGPASPLAPDDAEALASAIVGRALPSSGSVAHFASSRTLFALTGIGGALAVLGLTYAVASSGCPSGTCGEPAVISGSGSRSLPSGAAPLETTLPSAPAPLEVAPVPVSALPDVAAAPLSSSRAPAKRDEHNAGRLETPSDLLAEANRARRDREWAHAAALYERVVGSQADESYAAMIALASLRLEHLGDPRGALALYERALAARPNGALSVQAEAGAARCRRTLGDETHARPAP